MRGRRLIHELIAPPGAKSKKRIYRFAESGAIIGRLDRIDDISQALRVAQREAQRRESFGDRDHKLGPNKRIVGELNRRVRSRCIGGIKLEVADLAALLVQRGAQGLRSEEHTSELQSRPHLVCRLLLEKKN